MQEIHCLREQLTNIMKTIDPSLDIELDPHMPPPTKKQVFFFIKKDKISFFFEKETLIRQIITSGLIDQVAKIQKEGSSFYYSICNSSIYK